MMVWGPFGERREGIEDRSFRVSSPGCALQRQAKYESGCTPVNSGMYLMIALCRYGSFTLTLAQRQLWRGEQTFGHSQYPRQSFISYRHSCVALDLHVEQAFTFCIRIGFVGVFRSCGI
jgi:hypothetical protein